MPSLKQIEVEGGDLSTGTIGSDASSSSGGGEAKAASKCRKECDDGDVETMGVTTFDQQLARRKESAEKNGDMLNLCNDSDTEDTKSSAVKVKTEQIESKNKKKRKQSILEMMNPDYVDKSDGKDVDSEKENNSKKEKASKSSSIGKSSKKKKSKSGADIRNFYSLSPKESNANSPMAGDGKLKTPEGETTPKKRRQVGKFIGLNDDAEPLYIQLPFVGDDKNTAVTIDAHCVENKYDLSSPIVLNGKYSSRRRTKFQIESFLGGFGRYIH